MSETTKKDTVTSTSTDTTSSARAYRKVREGLVTSDKMDKTVVVVVEDRVKHGLYGKVLLGGCVHRPCNIEAIDPNSGGVGRPIHFRPIGG